MFFIFLKLLLQFQPPYRKIFFFHLRKVTEKERAGKRGSQFQESSTYLHHGWHGFNLKFSSNSSHASHDLISTAERFEAPKTPVQLSPKSFRRRLLISNSFEHVANCRRLHRQLAKTVVVVRSHPMICICIWLPAIPASCSRETKKERKKRKKRKEKE